MSQQEFTHLLHRIERNCEAMLRIIDEVAVMPTHAMERRTAAFTRRKQQLMELVGPEQSHAIALEVLDMVLKRHWDKPQEDIKG